VFDKGFEFVIGEFIRNRGCGDLEFLGQQRCHDPQIFNGTLDASNANGVRSVRFEIFGDLFQKSRSDPVATALPPTTTSVAGCQLGTLVMPNLTPVKWALLTS
jgi:hypothetical protein